MDKGDRVKLGIVCILFNRPLKKMGIYSILDALISKFDLLLFDNSNLPQPDLINKPYYHWSGTNIGTAGGYFYSIHKLEEIGCSHVMLLDQDTLVNFTFIEEVLYTIKISPQEVLTPMIKSKAGIISPNAYHWWFGNNSKRYSYFKRLSFISAISTGSVHPISLIKNYMPFPEEFWLDYFDHWLFYNYFKDGIKTKSLAAILNHDLSINNIDEISVIRLRNIYKSEKAFIYGHGPKTAKYFLFIRIVIRSIKSIFSRNFLKNFQAQWLN